MHDSNGGVTDLDGGAVGVRGHISRWVTGRHRFKYSGIQIQAQDGRVSKLAESRGKIKYPNALCDCICSRFKLGLEYAY